MNRLQISKLKFLRENILKFYKDGDSLDDKILITSFYMGYREYPKCLHTDCLNKANWI